jgi:hypothetical protein
MTPTLLKSATNREELKSPMHHAELKSPTKRIPQTVSAVIIAKNESPRIEQCIESVRFCDEVIVVDNGSTDDTVQLAKKSGAIVIAASGNFSELRMAGMKKAVGLWVLYIDADEIVTPELREEIRWVTSPKTEDGKLKTDEILIHDGYFIPRKNFYLGHAWPTQDRMQRLFLKSSFIRWFGNVHETAEITGTLGELKNPLTHNTHRTLGEMVEKTNEWSEIEADLRIQSHHPPIVGWRLFRVMLTGFFDSYIKQQGWKAGTAGLIESIFQAFSMFITYAKVWERQQKV